ncbi:coiled-coil domain-containing protein 114 [Lampris incognitus]|uniref:coiled-coil domain-containing protein 114 n=1 Tax=Lampris incognitus TaxID=2546036 RepID=UPI0024B555D1|nr:coiled-coil domain-containing protein 114 [Lampris incognitus]
MPRGRSTTSAHTESSEMDTDGIAETELAKLQRQFRIMEVDRQAYSIQSQKQIRKQRQQVEKLQKEQEEWLRSLRVSENVSCRQQDSEDTQSLRTVLEQRDVLEKELASEKHCQRQIEEEIADMERKLVTLKKGAANSSDTQKFHTRQTQKTIRTLESKLHRALICFSEQLTKNSHLREELETLRMERIRFQQIHQRLDKELQDIRKEIGEIITLSTAAYDARVEAQSKMTMMREKAVKDLAQFNAEMKELERVIAQECCLKEFMTTKWNERSGQVEGQEAEHKQLSELKEQKKMDSVEESMDILEETFERIKAVTGEDNLDMLVSRFIQVEDRNFALFNFVNEQNNEAEALRDQISQTQGEIEKFQMKDVQQKQERCFLLREIDERLKEIESQRREHEKQASIVSKIMDQLKAGVSTIFTKLECDRSVIEDMLGSSTGIRDNNIMSYLGLIEQKTNELLTIQAFLNTKDADRVYNPKDLAIYLLGQNPDMLKQNISIQPPVARDDYDVDESPLIDDEERPLSQRELRQRIME